MTDGSLTVAVRRDDGAVVIALEGELDMETAPLLERAFRQVQALGGEQLVLDLGDLQFIDAAGLRALLRGSRLFEGCLTVRSPRSQVRRLLALTGTDELLDMESPDKGEAARKLAYVRRLWEAFRCGGVNALAELVPDDVVWRPAAGGGVTLHGTDELARFWVARDQPIPPPAEARAVGEDVLVRARFPQPDGVQELWSLYRFNGPRLVEAVIYDAPPPGHAVPS